ncbi:MAG: PRC-barrel domain-containing protein [Rhodospirillales bacterium]|nr:PRC-barrel domain-containing protein [Rhodospirillales bacterium]
MLKRMLMTTSVCALLVVPAAAAQQGSGTGSDGSAHGTMAGAAGAGTNERDLQIQVASAADLIGAPVRGNGGEDLGEIVYLMIAADTGALRYALVAPEGGAADGFVPVAWEALQIVPERREARLVPGGGNDFSFVVDKQRLTESKQRYGEDQLAELTKPAVVTSVTEYWAPVASSSAAGKKAGQAGSKDGQSGAGGQAGSAGKTEAASADRKPASGQQGQQAASEQGKPHILVGRETITTVVAPAYRSAEQIRGSEVILPNDETFGEIDALIIDRGHGRIAYVQVGHGGFLGLGEEIAPVPFEALSYDLDRNAYRLQKSKAELDEMETFARGEQPTKVEWKDLNRLYKQFDLPSYEQVLKQS